MRPPLAGRILALVVLVLAACATGRAAHVRDLAGEVCDPLATDARANVLLFVDPECPISNAYAPEVRRLHGEFAPRGVRFWLVYADRARARDDLRAHAAAFFPGLDAVCDADHELVARAGAARTPEACVFLPDGALVYRGRIDDRYIAFGKQRAAATTHDLRAALEAVLAGVRPSTPWPAPIGCAIP